MNETLINSVVKSLFDSNQISENINPVFLQNIDKQIQNEILDSLDLFPAFDIAVSYVCMSGLQRLIDKLSNKPTSRFITTTEGFVTEPNSLKKLLNVPSLETRVFLPKTTGSGFHSKTYLFRGSDAARLIVGSANISDRAFGSVHESSLRVDMKLSGDLYKKHAENYERTWQRSTPLTAELIAEYEIEYYKNKQASSVVLRDRNEQTPQPNVMQMDALNCLEKTRLEGKNKSLVVASTGSGKTYLAAFDVDFFNPKKMLFLVHNRTILRKAKDTFKRVMPGRSMIELKTDNVRSSSNYDFVFSTEKTLLTNISNFSPDFFEYIVIDEAHHCTANQYTKIMNYFKPKFLLGMTATPDRPDSNIKAKDVYERFNHIIPYEIRLHTAIESDLICPFNYFGIGEDLADENIEYEKKVLTIRKNIDKYGFFGRKLKALVFVDRIETAKRLAEEFNVQGQKAVSISGETEEDLVDEYLTELGSDESTLEVIVSVNKLNEGIDVPEVNMIIMMRKTDSPIVYIQQLGRGLRLSEPGKFVTVLDFVGNYTGSYHAIQGLMDDLDSTGQGIKKMLLSTPTMLSNIQLDEISRQRIYMTIDRDMKGTKTILRNNFKNWVEKWGYIPTMLEYKNKTDKMDEILLNFDSFQCLKADLNYIQPSERYLDFFRHISQGLIQAGTKRQIDDVTRILVEGSGIIGDSFLKEYILGKFKTIVSNRNKFFVESDNKVWLDISDLLSNDKFKKDFDELIEFMKTLGNNSFVLHKNYRRLDIPFMAKRPSLQNLLEGQFYKNEVFYALPNMARQTSDSNLKYANKVIDSKHIIYITKEDSNSTLLVSGTKPIEFFIAHADSKDSFLTYVGRGIPKSVIGHLEGKEKSKIVEIELLDEMPKWIVDDYLIKIDE